MRGVTRNLSGKSLQSLVHPLGNSFRNPQRCVAPFDSGGLTGDLDDSWFPAEQASDGVLTKEPELR